MSEDGIFPKRAVFTDSSRSEVLKWQDFPYNRINCYRLLKNVTVKLEAVARRIVLEVAIVLI